MINHDFFIISYVDGLKTTEDYLDPEADTSSDAILNRKSRSLLATGSGLMGRRLTAKGKGQDKGDHKFLITDPTVIQQKKMDCIYLYTEKITGLLQKYVEKVDEATRIRTLVKSELVNISITPNNVQAKNVCPVLTKPRSSGSITIPFIDDKDKNLKIEIKLDFNVYRGQYWELSSKSEINLSGSDFYKLEIHHPRDITAGTQFSYSCQSLKIKSPKAKNGTLAEIRLNFARFQMQPYGTFKQNKREKVFRESFDCSTWFTVPLWTGTIVVLLFTAIVAMGVIALLDIKTMDRFENPKGKTITIAASE